MENNNLLEIQKLNALFSQKEREFIEQKTSLIQLLESQKLEFYSAQTELQMLKEQEFELIAHKQELETELLKRRESAEEQVLSIKNQHEEAITALIAERKTREQEFINQIENIRNELKEQANLSAEHLATLAQREKEFANELSKLRENENIQRRKLESEYQDKIQEISVEHKTREQEFAVELFQLRESADAQRHSIENQHKEAIAELSNEYTKREENLISQIENIRTELKAQTELSAEHLAALARREKEWIGREQSLNSLMTQMQDSKHAEAKNHLISLVQREKKFAVELLKLRESADTQRQSIEIQHKEVIAELSNEYQTRESNLVSQIENIRIELKTQTERSTEYLTTLGEREKEFARELKQIVDEKHTTELKNSDLSHLLTAAQLLESQLHDELAMRQKILSDLSRELKYLQGSFTWRITAPLRAIGKLFAFQADSEEVSVRVKILEDTPSEMEESIVSSEPSNIETNLSVLDSSVNTIIEESQIPKGEQPATHIKETFMSSTPIVTATSLDELLAYHDADFIHCAYITLLGRVPDPEGMHYYLGRIRAGRAKIAIIDQLVSSAEGKRYSVQMTGLEQALTRYRWGKMPIIGVFFQKDTIVQEIRQIESSMHRLNQDMNRRFDAVEQQIKQISYSVVSSPDAQTLGPDIYTTENSPDLSHISPSARKIYTMLKNAQGSK